MSNFGGAGRLLIEGRHMGQEIKDKLEAQQDKGSIIMLIATDIPLSERQLKRICRRAGVGLARTGSFYGNGSGDIAIAFTPDEEIGRGADLFDVAGFGADFAYTLDGGALGEVEFETFNAAAAVVTVTGKSIHPGSAKDRMVNAGRVAMEFDAMLPDRARPEHTEGYQGFFHLTDMSGCVESAQLKYILRDHDAALLGEKKALVEDIAQKFNEKYGEGTVEIAIRDQYRNMAGIVTAHPEILSLAREAVRSVGREPVSCPVRGGTDGATLSFLGLPCPNLGTGSHGHHGRGEFAVAEEMELAVLVMASIAQNLAK